jgi:Zn-dependent oligopeptidase
LPNDTIYQKQFNVDDVIQRGLLFVADKLYGLSAERKYDDVYQFDSEVMIFELTDPNGPVLGRIYFDLFARPNKPVVPMGSCVNMRARSSALNRNQGVSLVIMNLTDPMMTMVQVSDGPWSCLDY